MKEVIREVMRNRCIIEENGGGIFTWLYSYVHVRRACLCAGIDTLRASMDGDVSCTSPPCESPGFKSPVFNRSGSLDES